MVAAILERPIDERSRKSTAPPAKVPADLVRVYVAAGPDEATRRMDAMRFLGIQVWPGSDSLDADPEPTTLGLYVRRHDLTVARYVIEGPEPDAPDLFERAAEVRADARTKALGIARAYLGFGKFRRVIEMLEPLAVDPEAQDLIAGALLGCGRIREAERRAEAACAQLPPGAGRARAKFLAGVIAALGHDGTIRGAGSRLDVAVSRLTESAAESPRDLEAGKALIEALLLASRFDDALRELNRVRLVNANLTGLDGYWRTTWLDLSRRR